ncbi:GlxA family transcriptional regulator [Embleya sp. NBC_00896]|uniref:GlxA family transcriptional regulator n=1 Tax=Embleya sp. NBC_00896 TaxID=2975961 RepID=UPI003870EA06|nr:helix-turn-helix domain-containing protein [Embleya sp. NBC_00896]
MEKVAIVVFDGARMFDLAVATEVWAPHQSAYGVPEFEVRRCAVTREPVGLTGGAVAMPDRTLAWLRKADLVVVPGMADPAAPQAEPLLAALRAAHRAGVTVASLCAGAFVLGAAGLLDGRPAVTHWSLADDLARRFPAAEVDPGALFVGADRVWSSAGVAAGIDLCLHLIRLAHGADIAASVARSMVTAPFRTGGQAQFITGPTRPLDRDGDALAAVRERALRELDRPHTVADMAAWAGMSERTFARRFAAESGAPPQRWLLDQRVAAAQRLLERTDLGMDAIARRCGFGSAVTMRQHFTRHIGVPPNGYRRAFHPRPAR